METGLIKYKDIRNKTLSETVALAGSSSKLVYGNMKVSDLLIAGNIADLKFAGFDSVENFGRGVYIIYERNLPIYIGLANRHFFHRFSSHIFLDIRPQWGWNALLLKLAMRETGKQKDELEILDYHVALKKLYKCEVLRVSVSPSETDVSIRNLEMIFQRGLKHLYPLKVLNGRVKKVTASYMNTKLSELL